MTLNLKKRMYLILFSLLIVLLSAQQVRASENLLKVMTYNLGLVAVISKEKYDVRAKYMCNELKNSNMDIVFIQEVWARRHRDMLKNCGNWYIIDLDKKSGLQTRLENGELSSWRTKLFAHILGSEKLASLTPLLSGDKNNGDSGLMIFSKYPIMDSNKLVFSENGSERYMFDGEIAVNKGAIGGFINHPTIGKVFVATTHMVAEYDDHSYTYQRINQVKELVDWIDENSSEAPVIVGGDFNMAPLSSEFDTNLRNTEQAWYETRDSYLADYLEANELVRKGIGTYREEFSNKGPSDAEKEGRSEGVIDHIFSSKGLIPVSGRLVYSTTMIPFKNNKIALSDHHGIVTTFKLD